MIFPRSNTPINNSRLEFRRLVLFNRINLSLSYSFAINNILNQLANCLYPKKIYFKVSMNTSTPLVFKQN